MKQAAICWDKPLLDKLAVALSGSFIEIDREY